MARKTLYKSSKLVYHYAVEPSDIQAKKKKKRFV